MKEKNNSRLKSFKFKIIYIIIVTGIILFALEKISSRLLPGLDFTALTSEFHLRKINRNFMPSSVPNLFIVPKPNSNVFNSLGIYDKEYPKQKMTGTMRIMVLGDSVTQGAEYTPQKKIYHEILEKNLARNTNLQYTYEVWNCGVRKYNTQQELLYFKHNLLRYKPDIVILGYLETNDYELPKILYNPNLSLNENVYIAMVPRFLPVSEETHNTLCRSDLYKIINMGIYRFRARSNPELFPPLTFKNNAGYKAMEMNRKALLEMKQLCDKENIRFLMLVFPLLDNKKMEERDQWIYSVSAQKQIDAIYLLPQFLKHDKDLTKFRFDTQDNLHPTITGHALAAEILEKKLYSLGWIK
ncbi:MAG: SGNH/GDSL hydrolase family protein [bacterium]|nr:SGNH/GDSL hydrolase family protein [bacterium]